MAVVCTLLAEDGTLVAEDGMLVVAVVCTAASEAGRSVVAVVGTSTVEEEWLVAGERDSPCKAFVVVLVQGGMSAVHME